jgi:uncharacterized heparinase superfamily protein
VTGRLWPSDKFCFRIDFRHASELGDPKYVWERNRLQYLQRVAAHAAAARDAKAARFCIDEIESWMRANPPFLGINWASTVECSARILSLAIVCSLLGADAFSMTTRRQIAACFAAHGYWLQSNLSLHSSANNHLIVEAAGLYLIGVTAPGLPGAQAWLTAGQTILERETLLQFAPDGSGREQSLAYSGWSLEWLGLCAHLAERQTRPFPANVRARLAAAASALELFSDSGGHFPRIGDDDDATALHFDGSRDDWLHTVTALNRPEESDRGDGGVEDRPSQLLHAIAGRTVQRRAPSGFFLLREGGYTVMREPAGIGGCLVVLDHGPLGYLSIAAHGHADALAVWLHLDGIPVLVDSGTFAYGGDRSARDQFRGTPAHNTLSIGGLSSSRMSGAFNWSRKANCTLVAFDEKSWMVAAEHDGYLHDAGVVHRREVRVLSDRMEVRDELQGKARPLPVEIAWHLAPDLDAERTIYGYRVSRAGRPVMTVEAKGPLEWSDGGSEGGVPSGWYSPAFGMRVPNPRLTLCGELGVDMRVCTFFKFQ